MSLNGLDNVEVTQAYQGALAEAGGWFLLRYTSRDAVQVLTRGTGGAAEARAVVAAYTDKSPLYGLLLYRRRKVLVKYVPPDTSRLLQARVAVHFITVTDKFAPCDLVLSISTPEELSDAALASACTLHTAAPSSSSSSGSSRQQKLSWIQEAVEEGSQINGEDNNTVPSRPLSTMTNIPTIMEPTALDMDQLPSKPLLAPQPDQSPPLQEKTVVEAKSASEISHITIENVTESPPAAPESDLLELQETLKSYDKLFENGPEPRLSSQTTRPNYEELYEHYYAQLTKPKVRLGPRPRPSLDSKRPKTAGGSAQDVAKPKSSLPPGLRSASRKAASHKETPRTSTSSLNTTISIPPPPPIPMTPEVPSSPISPVYSSRSPASVRSMPVSVYSSRHRSTGMTQEKTRLMKALELRKKQQRAQAEKLAKEAEEAAAAKENSQRDDSTSKVMHDADTEDTSGKMTATASPEHALANSSEHPESNGNVETRFEENLSSSYLESSGLVFTGGLAESDDLNSTASVSSPISAQTHGSSGAPSTRPSSLSEDEHLSAEGIMQKATTIQETSTPGPRDEGQSVESVPTVISGNETPTLLDNGHIRSAEQPTTSEVAQIARPLGLTIPDHEDDFQSRRRSKRESMIYMPSADGLQTDETQPKLPGQELSVSTTSKRQSWYESRDKRRVMLDQLQISGENSETEYLSDDSFMEELQSATVQEARPMVVSKSPISPFFRKSNTIDSSTAPRSTSQPFQEVGPQSFEQLGRKSSGAWPPRSNTDSVVTAKKINVSSGISQRIKALAEKSQRESASSLSPASAALDTPGSTLAERKSSFFAAAPTEAVPTERPVSRLGSPSFLNSSPSTTPDKKNKAVKATVYNVQRGAERSESVQVTARIVRDERTKKPQLAMPVDKTPLDLHASPLIIDHQKSTWSPRSPTRARPEPQSPTALSSHSLEQNNPRASSESSWRSFGRRLSETRSIHSPENEEKREEKKEKKESRTSKMFKRMSSSMSSMAWKSLSNNNAAMASPEHDRRSTSLATMQGPPPAVQIGDLNVQFPDTLLWKRRWVEIDNGGNLVLSPSKSNEKGALKRFHLSEFRTPYPPDQDRQELPNSVVLDFIDGRTLQCACETYTAQAQVLQILREAHDAWRAYNQAL